MAEGSKYPVQRYYLYGLSWCVLSVFLRSKDKRSGALDFGAFLPVEEKEILKENRKIQRAGVFCMPVCAVGSILLALLYNQDYGWMRLLNRILNTRLSQGHEGFERYSIPLLGQEVVMNGNGGALHLKDGVEYFFLVPRTLIYFCVRNTGSGYAYSFIRMDYVPADESTDAGKDVYPDGSFSVLCDGAALRKSHIIPSG